MDQTTRLWLSTGAIYGLSCYFVYKLAEWLSPRLFKQYRTLSRRDQKDWDSRWSSTYHAVTISVLAAYVILISDTFDGTVDQQVPIMNRTSVVTNVSLAASLGYFLVDLSMMAKYYPWMGGAEMVVHHIAALLSVVRSLMMQQAQLYTLAMLATEMTTPCINLRWLMDKGGAKEHPIYTVNGLMLVLLWLGGRILLFVPFFLHEYTHRHELPLLKPFDQLLIVGVPILLLSLNTWWFSKIVKGALKVIAKTKHKVSDKQVKVHGSSVAESNKPLSNGMLRHRVTAAAVS